MTRKLAPVLAAIVLATVTTGFAQERPAGTQPAELPAEKLTALATATQGALVIVEYTLQYDKGEPPVSLSSGYTDWAPSTGRYRGYSGMEDVIKEERPYESQGILIDATHVVTPDLLIHPRFIKSIKVRRFDSDVKKGNMSAQRATASISAYPKQQNAVVLELSEALSGAKPIEFDAKRPGPYFISRLERQDGRWGISIDGAGSGGGGISLMGGKTTIDLPRGLIIDKEGIAVGLSTGTDAPADGSWKGSPLQWPSTTAAAMKDLQSKLETQAARGIVNVALNFRSPKNVAQRERMSFGDHDTNSAFHNALGVVIDEHTLLVLADLKPTITSKLERIKVMTDSGEGVDAKFKATLQDYGAFVAETERPLTGAPALSKTDVLDLYETLLPTGEIYLQGDKRIAYFLPQRIAGYNLGWRGNLYPQVESDEREPFVFDPEGNLLAIPLAQRQKVSVEERYRSSENRLTPVSHILKALSTLKEGSDSNNVPLTEEQENRLAWIGVELQGMNQELARANNVSDQTRDGESGALVTYVYADSPAAKAGIQPGWVLLRVDVENEPKPIEVRIESDPFADEAFPWDRLGDASETIFDRIPTPWPSAENTLIRTLTDLGFGQKYAIEFAHDGKVEKKDFSVIQGPSNYLSAPKYKDTPLGVTVRDMTYEVRRYMQKKPEDPGVIISKIELGSKASVSGLKPYEVVTHINDQPVMNVQDFEKLTKNQTDLRLSVKRMNTGRIVKVTLPARDAATQSK